MSKPKPLPSQDRLRELFSYDAESGVLCYRIAQAKMKVGDIAGSLQNTGYLRVAVDGARYKAHRIIWRWMTGDDVPEVDHKDTVRNNNRWVNLREATTSQNRMNARLRSDNTSGLKGAYFHKPTGRWMGKICADGVSHYLGLFDSKEAAHAAHCEAAQRLHGEFARAA